MELVRFDLSGLYGYRIEKSRSAEQYISENVFRRSDQEHLKDVPGSTSLEPLIIPKKIQKAKRRFSTYCMVETMPDQQNEV